MTKVEDLIRLIVRAAAFRVFLCISLLAGFVCAQPPAEAARKFDDFGDIQYSDLIARLDNFAIALQEEPNAKGFIIAYRSRRDLPGLSNRYAVRSKSYLLNSRGIARQRLVTVDGGDADCLRQELWIAPPGTTPIPRSDAYSRAFPDLDSARKFDEYLYDLDETRGRGEKLQDSIEADYLETFANALRSEKQSVAYVIAYAHFSKRRQLLSNESYDLTSEPRIDPAGAARQRLNFEREILTTVYGISPTRIRLIDGGYRKWRAVELWIVPVGEPAPIATPNSFPPKRNHR